MSNVPKGIAANDIPPLQYFFVNNNPCPQGPPGPTGPTGPIGFSGLGQGATGATGASGPPGTVGATGPQGAQGATGVQGNPGAPFLGIGTTGLAGPVGATGVQGVAGNTTFPGASYGVVVGNAIGNGYAQPALLYSNSTLNMTNGDVYATKALWCSSFGVPQYVTGSGNNPGGPIPSSPLMTISLNIVNPSTGLSLMDAPAIFVMANMLVRNTLVTGSTAIINNIGYIFNNAPAGNQVLAASNPDNYLTKVYQTRAFFRVLFRGVHYGSNVPFPIFTSNVFFYAGVEEVVGLDSQYSALGEWNGNMTAFGLY